jgi:2-polyprenyl-3-methyl-5-hydroxy-6-metoxy-1,4-benzoquinol methylase
MKKIQENQYKFPYHHIPYLDNNGFFLRYRSLSWSFKYFCYLLHIKNKVESFGPKNVLDVGCGDGRLLGVLDKDIRKTGVDFSKKAIAFASAFHPEIEFLYKDARGVEKEFDVVIAMEVLEHIPVKEVSNFLKTLDGRVARGGHCLISVPTTVQPLNKKHYRHYDLELFKKQLAEAEITMKIKSVEYVYKEPLWLKLYIKLTINHFWIVSFKKIENIIWKHVWKKLKITNKKNGHCMVVTLQKK